MSLVILERTEKKGIGVFKAILDLQDNLVYKVLRANRVWLALLGNKEMLGNLELKEILDPSDHLDCKVLQVTKVLLDLKDHQD